MSILINNGNDYQLNSSETFNSLKSSPSSTSSLSSISTSSSSSCHKRSKAVDLNRNTSNSQNSSISTAPTTATAANTTPRKTSITIPSKLPSLSIPLRNGNIDYSRYYNTNQEEDNQERQLQDGEPLSAPTTNNGTTKTATANANIIQDSFETIPCFSSTTNTTITSSRSNPTNSTPTSNDPSFPKQMINWNQFLQEEKDMNDNLSTINDDDKTFYMEQLNLNIGQTPNNNNNNNHGVSETENDLLPGTSKSLIAKYHYQLNYGDENENETNDVREYEYGGGESRKRKSSTTSDDRRPRRGGGGGGSRTSQVFRNTLNKFTFKPKVK